MSASSESHLLILSLLLLFPVCVLFSPFSVRFGEIALIEQTTRTASVQAIQDCILLYLSRERFIRFLKFAPAIESSTIFSELIMKRTANSLKCLPIFAPLKLKTVGSYHQFDEKRLALLGAMFQYLSVPAGTNIFNEGGQTINTQHTQCKLVATLSVVSLCSVLCVSPPTQISVWPSIS